jgi:hypothetical protein
MDIELTVILKNFTVKAGVIRPIKPGYIPNDTELQAIIDLCQDWDFVYESEIEN